MSRDEAAKYLGVGAGAVDRYAARGRLRARPSESGDEPCFDDGEVRRLKEEMDSRLSAAGGEMRRRRTLSLEEAVTATGLPRKVILIRVIEGRLRARWCGSAVRLRRDEVEELARGL